MARVANQPVWVGALCERSTKTSSHVISHLYLIDYLRNIDRAYTRDARVLKTGISRYCRISD